MEATWNQTPSFMLGQFYCANRDTHFGSIYRNEMEFHVFTRTKDGFCDKCDLNPTERTNEEGYKLPGHKFHSKAKQFPDVYFNNWQTNVLFTEAQPPGLYSCTVFKFDTKGNFLNHLLTGKDCFRLLTGTLRESEDFRDFLTCEEAKVGLKIHLQQNVKTKSEIYPNYFQINFGDLKWATTPTHVVNEVGYGYVILVRFSCYCDAVDKLFSHVQLFADCLKGTSDLSVLNNLPSYRIWIGPASYQNTFNVINCGVKNLRSAYDNVLDYTKGVMKMNHGKGFCIWRDLQVLSKYKRFGFDVIQKQYTFSLYYIPENYMPFSKAIDLNLAFLCKSILQISKALRQCRISDSRHLQSEFNIALESFRRNLISTIYLSDIGKRDIYTVKKVIRDYEYSDLSPWKVRELLSAIIKAKKDSETSKHQLFSLLKTKGVEFFPGWEITEEFCILQFGDFQQSQADEYWKENIEFFKTLITTEEAIPARRRRKFYINELEKSQGMVSVSHYHQQTAISLNMLEQYRHRNTSKNLRGIVKYSSVPKSTKLVLSNDLFGFPCLSSRMGGCSNKYNNWICFVCKTCLRYVEELVSVHCECGVTGLQNCLFNCLDKNHAVLPHYVSRTYENPFPRGEINLLLIGEPGVGKSTLINSLVNYQDFDNFQDSFNKAKIVSMVNIDYVDRARREMGTISHQNELTPEFYDIPLAENRIVRIIDTPGFKSTLNNASSFLASVLNYAKQFEMIHAVCIVIKATDHELSEGLRSLFQVLLTSFLPKGTKNLIFLFTHCDKRNEVPKIISELSEICWKTGLIDQKPTENNTFTMNNQAFPYMTRNIWKLTAVKPDFVSIEKSWKEAFQKCQIMFNCIREIRPFDPAINLRHEEKYDNSENIKLVPKKRFQWP